ncbi:MBL fold metallo-hydrolase [Roseofilum casamattae]|uniref:MBL fold metallo-hydrolase n=1 Tax=Roseofilum casamattae BLCC-M143 TaxID=3022442 RepID=A0ABT7BV74_9CYAN|nr:MBL fold metallo-hydrolase [Roseofilum casamattae]MDJ1183090.1 MBL fold metallo-hydrolase [Roseofilum casamattae BLCC-M143]
MARVDLKRIENVDGDVYVDRSCIDCDTCRWMAPEIFARVGDRSAVVRQPENEGERLRAMQALLSCPTASIGTIAKPTDIAEVHHSFPIAIADGVYHCGYHARNSYGAASYLIIRPEGNVLVDSPRFIGKLVQQIAALGGVRYLYLTHQDDVADHQKYRDRFQCDRILHEDDITPETANVEIKLTGNEPFQLASDLLVIPVPGHTKGHTVLLYNNRFLFSGDHLAWSDVLQHPIAFKNHCWYSWSELIVSMKRLQDYSFEWVLPGHGRRYSGDRQTMSDWFERCLAWMETV